MPMVLPAGGHAVFLDARQMVPEVPPLQYPGIGVVNALYLAGGIRAVELGSVMFGHIDDEGNEQPSPLELVRLAFPRRVYTQSHFDYMVEVIDQVWREREEIPGHRITFQPELLRHAAELPPRGLEVAGLRALRQLHRHASDPAIMS